MKEEIQEAYLMRLQMELINIGMEQQVREREEPTAIAALDRLLGCEAGSWRK